MSCVSLDIGPLIGMSSEVPAWQRSGVRKQCVYAGLILRRVEDELRFPVFLKDRVIMIHPNRAICVAVSGCANPKSSIVQTKGNHS